MKTIFVFLATLPRNSTSSKQDDDVLDEGDELINNLVQTKVTATREAFRQRKLARSANAQRQSCMFFDRTRISICIFFMFSFSTSNTTD